jgi:hypothetical protein
VSFADAGDKSKFFFSSVRPIKLKKEYRAAGVIA